MPTMRTPGSAALPAEHNSGPDTEAAAEGSAPPAYTEFDAMPLHTNLLRGIYSHGFEKPSAIQQRAIVPLIRGGDLVAQAQSGTGKTGAFAIGLLQRVDWTLRACQALVLAPTRELAQQTEEIVAALGEYMCAERFCHCFVGGTAVRDDVARLRSGVLVAVGTPGRVQHLLGRGQLAVGQLRVLVLDEADEMLSDGFAEQVYETFKHLPQDVQIVLVSATLSPEVLALSERFLRTPTRVLVEKERLTLEGIQQFYVAVEEEFKLATLMDLYESVSIAQAVIFCNTRRKADWLAKKMNDEDFTVSCLHADMDKAERGRVMKVFRSGSSRVLITTDVLSRGIDVQHVSIVANIDLPVDKAAYLHRIGRSGRYGRKGLAINFVSTKDVPLLKELQEHYACDIRELPLDFASYLD